MFLDSLWLVGSDSGAFSSVGFFLCAFDAFMDLVRVSLIFP